MSRGLKCDSYRCVCGLFYRNAIVVALFVSNDFLLARRKKFVLKKTPKELHMLNNISAFYPLFAM